MRTTLAMRRGRHLTEPLVVVRPPDEVGVRGFGDPGEEPVPLGCGSADEQADRFPEPFGPVGRVVHNP